MLTQESTLVYFIIPGHARSLHDLLAQLTPTHPFPPFVAGVAIVLFLSCNPSPQVLEHEAHCPQVAHLQSTEKMNEISYISTVNLVHFCTKRYHKKQRY